MRPLRPITVAAIPSSAVTITPAPTPGARRTPTRSSPAPSRRRTSRRTQASRDGPDRPSGDDEPPLDRLCRCGCGQTIPPGRRGYVDDAHSNRARQRRHKAQARMADDLLRYADVVWRARRRGDLTADEALELLLEPSAAVLQRLGVAA